MSPQITLRSSTVHAHTHTWKSIPFVFLSWLHNVHYFSMTLTWLYYGASICLHYVAWKLYGNKFCCTHCFTHFMYCLVYCYDNKFSEHEMNFSVFHSFLFPKLYANNNCLISSGHGNCYLRSGFFMVFSCCCCFLSWSKWKWIHFQYIWLVGWKSQCFLNLEWFTNSNSNRNSKR